MVGLKLDKCGCIYATNACVSVEVMLLNFFPSVRKTPGKRIFQMSDNLIIG